MGYGYAGASLIGQQGSFRHSEDNEAEWGRVVDEHEDGTITVEYHPGQQFDYEVEGVDEARIPADDFEVDSPH